MVEMGEGMEGWEDGGEGEGVDGREDGGEGEGVEGGRIVEIGWWRWGGWEDSGKLVKLT